MSQRYTLFVPLDQPIAVFLDRCYKKSMQNNQHILSRGKTNGIHVNIEWVQFFSELAKEIFAKRAEMIRAPGSVPATDRILMGFGYNRNEARMLSKHLFEQVLDEISLVSPDITVGELEEWNYGICEPNTLMISVPLS